MVNIGGVSGLEAHHVSPILGREGRCLFTFWHLHRLYSPKFYREGILQLKSRAGKSLVSDYEDKDRRWPESYVRMRVLDVSPIAALPLSASWSMAPSKAGHNPITGSKIKEWSRKIVNATPRDSRSWESIAVVKGLKIKTHGSWSSSVFDHSGKTRRLLSQSMSGL